MSQLLKSRSRNSAFTLIELLVVIAIIGILVSLTAAGVMKILSRGQMVAARTELSQLEAAIAAAKQNFGNVDGLPSIIKLYNTPSGFNNDALGIQTKNFLTKAFGKAWFAKDAMGNDINTPCNWMGAGYTGTYPVTLTGMEALVFWLGGIRDNNIGTFLGFSSYPSTPWDITNAKRKGPFYEFKQKQIVILPGSVNYTMVNNSGGAYAYFSSSEYAYFLANPLGGIVYPYHKSPSPPVASSSYYNPKTFQLISSGQDKTFGPGGYYKPPYTIGQAVFDDIANFSALQRGVGE
jgi:prepilin-type N-terminal cleavage/methylation domain-containing protein